MAELNWDIAQSLAARLLTVGHPYHPSALHATAQDLVNLCKGSIRGRTVVTPEEQALQLVERIRTEWDHWPMRGGTKQLVALAREMFGNKQPAANEFIPLGPKPEVQCPKCMDYGWRMVNGKYEWCECPAAVLAQSDTPALVDDLNAKRNCTPRGSILPTRNTGSIPSWMSKAEVERQRKQQGRERRKMARRLFGKDGGQ